MAEITRKTKRYPSDLAANLIDAQAVVDLLEQDRNLRSENLETFMVHSPFPAREDRGKVPTSAGPSSGEKVQGKPEIDPDH
jgi:hypothetical protein